MVLSKTFIKAAEFDGLPKLSNFQLIEEEIGELQNNEILVEAEFLSVDPYQRAFPYPVGSTVIGAQIARYTLLYFSISITNLFFLSRVLDSKNPNFPVDAYVCGHFGWRTHTKLNPDDEVFEMFSKTYLLPDFKDLSPSYGLGALGMSGLTAYFGLLEVCTPKAGETLVVSTAAGSVGSLVGQIGKIKGLSVIGITGSDEKCRWLESELGFVKAINYKTSNIFEELQSAAPNGVDCYFDNVGGEISSTVMSQMNKYGRIAVCGSLTTYNGRPEEWPKVSPVQPSILFKQLRMQGFNKVDWMDRFMEASTQIFEWIQEGKITPQETVTEGFENTPTAFLEMLRGSNVGKAVVKV